MSERTSRRASRPAASPDPVQPSPVEPGTEPSGPEQQPEAERQADKAGVERPAMHRSVAEPADTQHTEAPSAPPQPASARSVARENALATAASEAAVSRTDDPARPPRETRQSKPAGRRRVNRSAKGATAARRRRPTGRLLLAAATVLALGGTVTASSLLTLPRVDALPARTEVTPVADGVLLGCAGPLLQLTEAAPGASSAIAAVGAPVHAAAVSAEHTNRPLTAALEGSGDRAFAVESPPDPAGSPVLGAAAQSQYGSAGLIGLVASACTAPTGSAWLVGGSTELGRTTFVNLLNPTAVAATVDLAIVGEEGPVSSPGASGIAVPPGAQVVVPLSGLAPDLTSPVVAVRSRGGQVVATLQQSTVRGIEPGGVDTIGATPAPARQLVIPGVRVSGTAAVRERAATEGFEDLHTVVRVHVPGDEHTEVRIGAVGDAGESGASLAFHLEPDQVVDVPIDSLADGSYTVTVDADVPVVAAVRTAHIGPDGSPDLAWLAPSEALPADAETWISVTPGPAPRLFLHNAGPEPVTGTLSGSDRSEIAVSVEPGSTAVVRVTERTGYRLTPDGPLHAVVSYLGERGIAGYPVPSPAAQADPVVVYPG